jgi:hypothetical protein
VSSSEKRYFSKDFGITKSKSDQLVAFKVTPG